MSKSFPAYTGVGYAFDVGGTKARGARLIVDRGRVKSLEATTTVPIAEVRSWANMLESFETPLGLRPDRGLFLAVCIAGVGDQNNTVRLSHYPGGQFEVGKDSEHYGFGNKLFVTNDFIGAAGSVNTPAAESSIVVRSGVTDPLGAGAVLGPGTGCGVALIAPGQSFRVHGSEGGNTPISTDFDEVRFERRNDRPASEWEFLDFLRKRVGSGRPLRDEQIISGGGLALCHEFATGERLRPHQISALVEAGEADETMNVFATYFGRKVRQVALMFFTTRGVWLAGGVIQKTPRLAQCPAFARAFDASPTESHDQLLANIPIRIFQCDEAPLWGVGALALERLNG